MKYWLLAFCVALSLTWFVNKNALFDGLEYTVDVFTNLQAARSVFVGDSFLHEYLSGGLKGVHNHFILLLIGPLTLILGAKAYALLNGRFAVSPADIRRVAHPVLRHRVLPNFAAEAEGVSVERIIDELLRAVQEPKSGIKA